MIEIKVVQDDTGNIRVEGNVDATYACYAMLEIAKDVVRARSVERMRPSAIVPANGVDPRALKLNP